MLKSGSLLLALALVGLAAPDAAAQMRGTDKLFVNVNGGYQVISKDFETTSEFTVYDEPAILTASQSLKSKPIFDGSVGYRVWDNLAIGIGVSWYSADSDVNVTARIPHPLFFDQLRTVGVTAPGAKHTSLATHIMAVWFWPFTDKIDFAFSAGPSIIAVKQELVSGISIQPESGPSFTNPTVTDISVIEQKKTAIGVNLGFDAAYMVTKRYGFGAGARYVIGSADLPGLSDSLTVGGFQVLGGLRVRF